MTRYTQPRPSWVHAIQDMALDLAVRCESEERFVEQWMRLGVIVRYLATHDPMTCRRPVLDWGRWEWWTGG